MTFQFPSQRSYEQWQSELPGLWPDASQQRLLAVLLGDHSVVDALDQASLDQWVDELLETADRDPRVRDLLPITYHCLIQQGLEPREASRLRMVRVSFAAIAQKQSHCWTALLEALQNAGLEPVLLKGNSLIVDYYDDGSLRPMTDADLFVAPSDHERADTVLRAQGWYALDQGFDQSDADFEHATPYTRDDRGWTDIDLHMHVLSKCHHPAIDAWFAARTEHFEYNGLTVRRLEPTALLTHLLLHGLRWSKHTPIRWVIDAYRVLDERGSEIDWDAMLEFGRAHRLTWRLALALLYLHERFDVAMPVAVVERLRSHRPTLFERLEVACLLRPFSTERSLPYRLWHLLSFMVWRASRMRGGWHLPVDTLRVLRHKVGRRSLSTALHRAWHYGRLRR